MAATGFRLVGMKEGVGSLLTKVLVAASYTFRAGEALNMASGVASAATAAQLVTHIYNALITPSNLLRPATPDTSTTAGENALVYDVGGSGLVYECDITPTINGTAANANASTTSVLVTFGGGATDFNGGQVYIPELDEQRTITVDAFGAGVHTFTVTPAFSRAPTTGDTVRAVGFSKGRIGVKLDATTPSLKVSTAIADLSGGKVNIEDVNLKARTANVSFPLS
jgi:hypothetical protein